MLALYWGLISSYHIFFAMEHTPDKVTVAVPYNNGTIANIDFSEYFQTEYQPTGFIYRGDYLYNISIRKCNYFPYQFTNNITDIEDNTIYFEHIFDFYGKTDINLIRKMAERRKYPYEFSLDQNGFLLINGQYPELFLTYHLRLAIIKYLELVGENSHDPLHIAYTVPKFWTEPQRAAVAYTARQLGVDIILIDSTAAAASFLQYTHKEYLSYFPHRILFLYIGETWTEVTVLDFMFSDRLTTKERLYHWDDTAGMRDIKVSISELIKKKTKGTNRPGEVTKRIYEASKIAHRLGSNHEINGTFGGVHYSLSRKEIEKATQSTIKKIEMILDKVGDEVNNVDLDIIAVAGPGVRFPPIVQLIRSNYGGNRIKIVDEKIKNIFATGAANLVYQTITIDTPIIYSLEVRTDSSRFAFSEGFRLPSGNSSFVITSDHIPIGVSQSALWVILNQRANALYDQSRLLKMDHVGLASYDLRIHMMMEEIQKVNEFTHQNIQNQFKIKSIKSNSEELLQLLRTEEDIRTVIKSKEWKWFQIKLEKILEKALKINIYSDVKNSCEDLEKEFLKLVNSPLLLRDEMMAMRLFFRRMLRTLEELEDQADALIFTGKVSSKLSEESIQEVAKKPLAKIQLWIVDRVLEVEKHNFASSFGTRWGKIQSRIDELMDLYLNVDGEEIGVICQKLEKWAL